MPHIISDQEHRANQAMKDYLQDPAPLPLPLDDDDDDIDMRASCGLIEEDDFYPEAENEAWNK